MKKIANYFRYIIGGFCVLLSIAYFGESFLEGLFFLLFGVSFFPVIYKKINKFKKISIVLPIVLFILFGISIPESSKNTQDIQNNPEINQATVEEKEIIPIQELKFEEITVELDMKQNKHIKVIINPDNTNDNIDSIEFKSSNESVAKIEKYNTNTKNNEKYAKIIPVGEGECVIYAQFGDTIKSNEVSVKVTDNDRIEREKAAAEQAQKEAEEKAKAEAEAAKVQAQAAASTTSSKQRKTTSTTSSTSKAKSKSTSSKASSNKSYGQSVYVTPKGKRYHYSPTCGGKNSTASTLSAAQARGLTPCKKCAR